MVLILPDFKQYINPTLGEVIYKETYKTRQVLSHITPVKKISRYKNETYDHKTFPIDIRFDYYVMVEKDANISYKKTGTAVRLSLIMATKSIHSSTKDKLMEKFGEFCV